jgi:hypothetical protein
MRSKTRERFVKEEAKETKRSEEIYGKRDGGERERERERETGKYAVN